MVTGPGKFRTLRAKESCCLFVACFLQSQTCHHARSRLHLPQEHAALQGVGPLDWHAYGVEHEPEKLIRDFSGNSLLAILVD